MTGVARVTSMLRNYERVDHDRPSNTGRSWDLYRNGIQPGPVGPVGPAVSTAGPAGPDTVRGPAWSVPSDTGPAGPAVAQRQSRQATLGQLGQPWPSDSHAKRHWARWASRGPATVVPSDTGPHCLGALSLVWSSHYPPPGLAPSRSSKVISGASPASWWVDKMPSSKIRKNKSSDRREQQATKIESLGFIIANIASVSVLTLGAIELY